MSTFSGEDQTVKEIEEVLTKIIQKITKYLERQKIIIKDDSDGGFQMPIHDEDTLSKLQATSVTYRFATGKKQRQKGDRAKVRHRYGSHRHKRTRREELRIFTHNFNKNQAESRC